jgi:hypothetical protein
MYRAPRVFEISHRYPWPFVGAVEGQYHEILTIGARRAFGVWDDLNSDVRTLANV